jgi:N-acetylglucosaminyldiphosphoundecaprenol N-acetyl-beta-D-mannosaminyltransferase
MRKHILDIPIDWLSEEELLRKLKLFVTDKKPRQITTVNPEFIVLSQQNEEFKHVLQNSDLSLADGTGIVIAQTLLEKKPRNKFIAFWRFLSLGFRFLVFPQSFEYKRITGVELTDLLLRLSVKEKLRLFLLGAAPGVAQKAAQTWQKVYPTLEIVGASASNPQDAHTLAEVKAAKPDILLVAYGAPKQDLFIARYKDELKLPIMVGIGGTFDYAAGTMHRAPAFMRAIGLEWFARLVQQPKRLKRIWRSTVVFVRYILQRD